MTTRADIRTRVRDDLNDNGSTKLWADALLNRWIGEAIKEWSRVVPRDRAWQTTSAANTPSYTLPSDVLEVVRVEHPAGIFRVRGGLHDGDVGPSVDLNSWPRTGPLDLSWEQWGGQVFLIPAPSTSGETLEVRYKGAYSLPSD